MANHVQDQILAYVQTLLAGAGTTAQTRVYTERMDLVRDDSVPFIEIKAGEDTVRTEQGTIGFPRTELHFFQFMTHCTVAVAGTYRVDAGNLAKQVQAALNASRLVNSANGIARNGIQLQGMRPEQDPDAAKPLYSIELVWVAGYMTASNAPDVPL